jgi:hypothetical protein
MRGHRRQTPSGPERIIALSRNLVRWVLAREFGENMHALQRIVTRGPRHAQFGMTERLHRHTNTLI